MKTFANYQYVEGEPMSERDKREAGSKFWNEGKWENFVVPFLPEGEELTLVDMGCNAGLFLKLAEDRGFDQVIGVEANRTAWKRAMAYRKRNGGRYEVRRQYMQGCIDDLPVADVTVLANAHYYFLIGDWLEYLDRLRPKTRLCVVVTAEKRVNPPRPRTDPDGIRGYFRDWEEVGCIDPLPLEGDPFPRELWGLCFRSPLVDRIPVDELAWNVLKIRYGFWTELDRGVAPAESEYFRFLRGHWSERRWPDDKIERFLMEKAALYESVKANRLLKPIVVDRERRILEGRHRYGMMRHLGHRTVMVREV